MNTLSNLNSVAEAFDPTLVPNVFLIDLGNIRARISSLPTEAQKPDSGRIDSEFAGYGYLVDGVPYEFREDDLLYSLYTGDVVYDMKVVERVFEQHFSNPNRFDDVQVQACESAA